ncbi:hypothetical protein BXO88_06820 [Oribacterium sp. C9]|uniref:glycoside hydrolase family 2 protein n=1 Tax=Oribacterium sp. C9 TaxID=1943579 RepID=UPI00098F5F8C|nr:glycoside hydrolase family 2 TIM barrel-domain containing protein [Oribacterium sp. C9]OON86699.1 hypothetical protein BXO88_06820 [Oribacterium sp. C9]
MHKISFNEGWIFRKIPDGNIRDLGAYVCGDENSGNLCEADAESVDLPHTWYCDDEPYRGLVLYTKTIRIKSGWRHVFIDIPGADQHAVVYAGDRRLCEHKGAYAAFRCEIPEDMLHEDMEIDISIFLSNVLNEGISPLTGDFTIFGGLYRGVNLLVTESDSYFDPTYYGTCGVILRTAVDGADGVVSAEIHARVEMDTELRAEIFGPDGEIVAEENCEIRGFQKVRSCHLFLRVSDVKLWNGKKAPDLYRVKLSLMRGGKTDDEVELETGFRDIGMTADEGLFLNGEHLKIRGVSKHQDFKGCFHAVSREHIEKDFFLIDEIGANSVRLSHYQHPQYTYEFCDRKGYLVWAEIPMLKMTESATLRENAEEQLRELILQNIHHPSVYCWGIQNEIGMFRDTAFMHEELRRMQQIAHELDPSRLVTAANLYTVKFRSELNATTDMVGYNVYFGWYYGEMRDYDEYLDRFHHERPEMPLGVSEYGVDANIGLHSEEPMVRDYSEEYQALFHETVYPIFERKDYLWGSYVWNMFDFSSGLRKEGGQENINAKGLVTYDRNTRKDAFYYYKAKWSEDKFLHICSKRFMNRAKDEIDVKVYTNCDAAELFLDGRSFGQRKTDGNGVVLFERVPLHDGENVMKVVGERLAPAEDYFDASKGDERVTEVQNRKDVYEVKNAAPVSDELTDSCVFVRVDSEDESYRLPGNEAGQAVKNWFLSEDDIVKEGYFSIKDTANDLLENRESKAVLERYLPGLVRFMTEKDVIPLGLSMQSILNRNTPEGLDVQELNRELNKVKNEW